MTPGTKMVPGSVYYPGPELRLLPVPEPQEVALPRELLRRVAMLKLPSTPQARAVVEEVARAGIAFGGLLLLLVVDPCRSFAFARSSGPLLAICFSSTPFVLYRSVGVVITPLALCTIFLSRPTELDRISK